MLQEMIVYENEGREFEAFAASMEGQKPLVILCHAWAGKDDFIMEKTLEIASWGYTGFALDLYGKGVLGKTKEENIQLKKPFMENRDLIKKRVLKAYEVAKNLPYANPQKIAVLGFGFGAVMALDLARSNVPLDGVISIYGHFDPPPNPHPIQAKVLILHGYNDPISSQEELHRFEKTLTQDQVDWQAHLFGDTYHAFANPKASDLASGVLYNKKSADKAWWLTRDFLNDLFS